MAARAAACGLLCGYHCRKFIALQKKEELRDEHSEPVIRPVAIGEVWRRVIGRRIFSRAVTKVLGRHKGARERGRGGLWEYV
eukprot:scaffold7712_cov119-Isochrysis_galbana.AAC.1